MKFRSLSILVTLAFSVSLPAQGTEWPLICAARKSFLERHLQIETSVSPDRLIQEVSSRPDVDLLILSDAHYQPTMNRLMDFLKQVDQQPNYNCLFLEATEESWAEDFRIVQDTKPGDPLYFIKQFHKSLEDLNLEIIFVDDRQRVEQWYEEQRGQFLNEAQLEELAFEELTYRNLVMSRRIAIAMNDSCDKSVFMVGPNHLSSFSRGYPVTSVTDYLALLEINTFSVLLLDSELFFPEAGSLRWSITSPALCFDECSYNPEFPKNEVAFFHKGSELNNVPLLDVTRMDIHYGAALQGQWSDFEASIIFPPKYLSSCEDRRGP